MSELKEYIVFYTSIVPIAVSARSKQEAIENGHVRYNLNPEKFVKNTILKVSVKRVRKKGGGNDGEEKNNSGRVQFS